MERTNTVLLLPLRNVWKAVGRRQKILSVGLRYILFLHGKQGGREKL